MPFKTGKKILETHLNTSKAQRKTWKRVRTLAKTTGKTILEARKTYKNLTETQKKALDTPRNPEKDFDNTLVTLWTTTKTVRRPSKGNPKRSVRAGAPNEYIQETQQPPLVTLQTLKKLKEICKEYFGGDWNLLKQSAKALESLLTD